MNRIENNRNQLFTQADSMAAGLQVLEAQIGIRQNTEAALRTDLQAAKQADAAYHTAVAASAACKNALASASDDSKFFIEVAKRVIATFLGMYWSPEWSLAGFTNKSLVIPREIGKRQLMLESLER